jgi:predicted RNA-binding protein
VVAEDVARVAQSESGVELSTLFGESRLVDGYAVGEVDLTENYVILRRTGHVARP